MPSKASSKLSNHDICNDTMSAKNFSLAKTDQMRLRNAMTFCNEEQKAKAKREGTNLALKLDQAKKGTMTHHNRSVLSNGDVLT